MRLPRPGAEVRVTLVDSEQIAAWATADTFCVAGFERTTEVTLGTVLEVTRDSLIVAATVARHRETGEIGAWAGRWCLPRRCISRCDVLRPRG